MNPDNTSQRFVLQFSLMLMVWAAIFCFCYTVYQEGIPASVGLMMGLLAAGVIVLAVVAERHFVALQRANLAEEAFFNFYRSEEVFTLFQQLRKLRTRQAEVCFSLEEAVASKSSQKLIEDLSSSLDGCEGELGLLEEKIEVAFKDSIPAKFPKSSKAEMKRLFERALAPMERLVHELIVTELE